MSKLADEIIKELFTNGNGEKAARLVLTSDDGHDLGGWSEIGARCAIKRAQHRMSGDSLTLAETVQKEVLSTIKSNPL
jgi:hypothetical protein